jgi:serine/threonine protein phosphatase PrpC
MVRLDFVFSNSGINSNEPIHIKPMKFKLTANTHVGEVRDHNEDNFFVCSDLATDDWSFDKSIEYELGDLGSILIVADGMGGMNAGEVASAIAVESSKSYFTENKESVNIQSEDAINEFLKNAIVHAHQEILQHQNSHPETAGMGTTLIIGWVINGVAYVGWCGDSRAYLYNPNLSSSGRAKQFEDIGLRVKGDLALVSKDHSYVQTLVDKGDLNYSQAFFHPESNIITQSLGQSGQDIAPSTTSLTLFEGDMLILCSDGINAMLEDGEIATICSENTTAPDVSSQLISNANEKGGHDNSTVTIFHTLSASHSIDNPLASAIKRDLNERKAPKSNLLKLIVLVLLIGGTLGALYTSFKDDLNLEVLSEDTKQEFIVLESDLSLEKITLYAGDKLFLEERPGMLPVIIAINDLRSVTTLDSSAFENEVSRYFYISDESYVEDGNQAAEETAVEDSAKPDTKDEPFEGEPKETQTSESEKTDKVSSGVWRVQLSTNNTRSEKSKVFNDLNVDEISIQKIDNSWVYFYGCFNSKEEAQDWINAHPKYSKNGQIPVGNISCDIADDELVNSDEIKEVKKDLVKSVKGTSVITKIEEDGNKQSASDQELKPTETVVATDEKQEERPQADSNVEESDTLITEGDKNI